MVTTSRSPSACASTARSRKCAEPPADDRVERARPALAASRPGDRRGSRGCARRPTGGRSGRCRPGGGPSRPCWRGDSADGGRRVQAAKPASSRVSHPLWIRLTVGLVHRAQRRECLLRLAGIADAGRDRRRPRTPLGLWQPTLPYCTTSQYSMPPRPCDTPCAAVLSCAEWLLIMRVNAVRSRQIDSAYRRAGGSAPEVDEGRQQHLLVVAGRGRARAPGPPSTGAARRPRAAPAPARRTGPGARPGRWRRSRLRARCRGRR